MYEIKTNAVRNTLFVTLKGVFTAQQSKEILKDIPKKLSQLKNDFTLLTDMCSLKEIEDQARPYIEKTMNLLNKHGVSKIIRIIPESSDDIGFNIMSLFHYSKDVKITTFKSFKELVENIL
ncbi:MAG: hypothetical protein JW867_02220 [Candidatus Omnitrophica bacterium]|nr:hypothetical protein [Candidatus Omnitrophota bacterium]